MKVNATYFQNDAERPLVYGEVEIKNTPRRRLRGEEEKLGIEAETVIVGFCGTDNELMRMGRNGKLSAKFPAGYDYLVNGHEGLVWVPSQNRFAVVLIRGGDSCDPTRYTEDETYFEYGCDQAHGLFSDRNYYNEDMLLPVPEEYIHGDKADLSFAKKMVFADPYACMLFQLERMEDLGSAHTFRVEMAKRKIAEDEARKIARDNIFKRTVIFGLGTTGIFIADLIKQSHPEAEVVFVARSSEDSQKARVAMELTKGRYLRNNFSTEEALADEIIRVLGGRATTFIGVSGSEVEHRIAFQHKVLGCNGIYNSFSLGPKISYDTMPFGFENHLIFGSINFRQAHMEEAIKRLSASRYDELVELIDKEEFIKDPLGCYANKIYSKDAPLKTAVLWNEKYLDKSR